MSRVLTLRLNDDQMERLKRAAAQWGEGKSPSQAAAVLLEEALRHEAFPRIEFRYSGVVRQAYIEGTRLAIWQVVQLADEFAGDATAVAAHLEIPVFQVEAALDYAVAYRDEIDAALEEYRWNEEHIRELIPDVKVFTVDSTAP